MIFDLFTSYISVKSYDFEKRNNDDFYDKLSRKYSAIFLVLLSTLFSMNQLFGKPLECWCPKEYSGAKCGYATSHCFVTNFHVPPLNSTEYPKRNELNSHKIFYYQWLPFIFLFQAFLFILPSLLWQYLSNNTGYDLNWYITSIKNDKSDLKDSSAIVGVSNHIKTCLDHNNRNKMRFLNKITLTFYYLCIKFIYAFLALFQICLVNYWLRDVHYAYENPLDLLYPTPYKRLIERFPRMVMCNFDIFILNEPQTHWVQCVLPVNVFLEKIYFIVYIWFCILFVLTLFGILSRIISLFYADTFLQNGFDYEIRSLDFKNYITTDGILVLQLIKNNTNILAVKSLLSNLYKASN